MLLNVCLLVLRLLFFEKFAGAPYGQKYKYGMGAPTTFSIKGTVQVQQCSVDCGEQVGKFTCAVGRGT